MITEKERMIVGAVNEWKGNSSHFTFTFVYMTDGGYFVFGGDREDDDFYTRVCTRKEFNKCVDELSEAKWMQKPMKRSTYVTAKVCTMVFNKPHRFIVGYNIDTFEIMVAVEYDTNASVMWSEDIKALLAIECERLEGARND